ncbi:MAG: hypothetical protein C4581_13505 [Nitrospiraceae bacterium]|nr:MAG: hypothetical protein C4581_13505 [Nitrospiraceae bacterium]
MKRFLAFACIIALTLGLLLVGCQKKEEAAAPAVTHTEEAKPAEAGGYGEKKEEAAGYGEEKPAAGGYGEEKKEEAKH